MKITRYFLSVLILLNVHSALADEIVSLDTREGVKQVFAILEPGQVKGVIILLPGHDGMMGMEMDGDSLSLNGPGGGLINRPATREILAEKGYVVVIPKPPTDNKYGMNNSFRASKKHAADLGAVIRYISSKYSGKDIFLWGHSRSTISGVNVTSGLESKGIKGLILTSTWKAAIENIPESSVKLPVLVIHHVKDDCDAAHYSDVAGIVGFFKKSGASVTQVDITGGRVKYKGNSDDSCQSNVHSMKKVIRKVTQLIAAWMAGEEVPDSLSWK